MRTALITGASRGLGLALCERLAGEGWRVAALSRTQGPDLAALAARYAPRLAWFACDVTRDSAFDAVRAALDHLGSLELLVNNAGISGWSASLAATETAEVQALLDTHALGCLRITRAAAPALLATPGAQILNISSRLGSIARTASGEFAGRGFSYSYRMAKAAQNMLSACLAEEFGPQGVRVSALHPGQILSGTASNDAAMSAQAAAERICRWLPLRGDQALVYQEPEAESLPW